MQRTAEAIQDFLVGQVAVQMSLDQAEIHIDAPFASYGLDSIAAVALTADLEDLLGIPLPATLAWDYPTIAQLARFLAEEAREQEGLKP